jgi:SNF2 family DNA or RNA helicase
MANIKNFIEDPKVRLIVLHPKSAAHGITLTVAHYMIFASIDYSFESYYQSVARIERASQKHPMFVYPILAKDTIDEAMWSVLTAKEVGQAGLIDQNTINSSIIQKFSEM